MDLIFYYGFVLVLFALARVLAPAPLPPDPWAYRKPEARGNARPDAVGRCTYCGRVRLSTGNCACCGASPE